MVWIPLIVFSLFLVAGTGAYFLIGSRGAERAEVRKRLSLLELSNLQGEDIPDVLKNELLSDVPVLNQVLAKFRTAVRIDRRLKQAGLEWNVGTFVLASGSLFIVGVAAGMFLHWPAVIAYAVGGIVALAPNTVVNVKKRLRVKKFTSHFPDALEMFARSLRAGHSFTGAIQLVAQEMPDPVGGEFRKVFEEQNLGIPLRHALIGMTERIDSLDARFFVTAILIQRETGGNLAEIIDKIAYVIRERFRIQGQLRIFTAQARLTGFILALLPVGVAGMIGMMGPQYLKPLWLEPAGRIIVMVAITMQVVGALVIRKIIRIKI